MTIKREDSRLIVCLFEGRAGACGSVDVTLVVSDAVPVGGFGAEETQIRKVHATGNGPKFEQTMLAGRASSNPVMAKFTIDAQMDQI